MSSKNIAVISKPLFPIIKGKMPVTKCSTLELINIITTYCNFRIMDFNNLLTVLTSNSIAKCCVYRNCNHKKRDVIYCHYPSAVLVAQCLKGLEK